MKSGNLDKLKTLLEKALAGDVRAWNDFFQEIRQYLHAQVHRAAGANGNGPLDHSALVQTTLRRVWENIDKQFPDGAENANIARFLGWIKKILLNRRLEELRKLARRPTVASGSAIEAVPDCRPLPAARNHDGVAVEMAAALARLPEKKRRVVELFWFEGLPDAEISTRLGCSVDAVKVLRCRAAARTPVPETPHSSGGMP